MSITLTRSASCLLILGLVGCGGLPETPSPEVAGQVEASAIEGSIAKTTAPLVVPEVGYTDTPVLPGTQWHVHDGRRPQPTMVLVGDHPQLPSPGAAPSDARILFDGNDLSQWTGRDDAAGWRLVEGAMEVNGTGDITTRDSFGDVQLHLEFRTPPEVKGSSQGRGNSGVFFMGRYEVQLLDSWKNPTYPDGQCGAIYGQKPPLVNASRPPGEWQSYDIVFHTPRLDDKGAVTEPARVTVFHNGVLLHHDVPIQGDTRHRALPSYAAPSTEGPIRLQDHGNPVRFRNIWIRPLES
ncbi:MAG: family 16 glycoside hydrolase [Planctomycetota bacterium]|jgi:hypothetical protein